MTNDKYWESFTELTDKKFRTTKMTGVSFTEMISKLKTEQAVQAGIDRGDSK